MLKDGALKKGYYQRYRRFSYARNIVLYYFKSLHSIARSTQSRPRGRVFSVVGFTRQFAIANVNTET